MVVHHDLEKCAQKDTIKDHNGRLTVVERFMWTAGGAIGVLLVVVVPILKQGLDLLLDMRNDRQQMAQVLRVTASEARGSGGTP
jgi:hypothetical protein